MNVTRDVYRNVPRITPAALALAQYIRPGDVVVCGQSSAQPLTLTEALVAQQPSIGPLTAFIGLTFTDTFDPSASPGLRYLSFGVLGTQVKLSRAGRLEVVPCHYSELPRRFDNKCLRADVVLLSCSPPGPDGVVSLGTSHDYVVHAARQARVVILEENEHMPPTIGAPLPTDLPVAAIVTSKRALPLVRSSQGDAADHAIAQHVAGLVPEGATLQIGVGSTPDAVIAALAGHRRLGMHSGLLTEAAFPLIESGAIDNSAKTFDTGVSVAGMLAGSERFYEWARMNRAIEIAPTWRTHGLEVTSKLHRFVSINTGIEVDLAGRVNAEIAGHDYVGGTGGLVDFVRAAAVSIGGRSIIAIKSTVRGETISRVVARCQGSVTVAASDVDTVVTEWGIAELRGQPLAERAKRIAAIAHPKFRDGLLAG